jgi:hypothetical protein
MVAAMSGTKPNVLTEEKEAIDAVGLCRLNPVPVER